MKERNHFEDPDVDVRIMLKWILKKYSKAVLMRQHPLEVSLS